MFKHMTSKFAAAAAVPLLAVLLGACGTTNDHSAPKTTAGAPDTPSIKSFDDYQLALAGCMRDKGLNMPDPSAGGGLSLDAGGDVAAFSAGIEACGKQLGPPPAREGGAPRSDEKVQADQLKIAQCLRENGVDVPDPQAGQALSIPASAPADVMEKCAPEGVTAVAGPGGK